MIDSERKGPADTESPPRNPYAKRTPFPGAAFFKLPTALYDQGYAARMSPSMLARYCTFLRLSNFNYGRETIPLSAGELEMLDGISPRTARHVNTKLLELGLLRRSETNRRALVLVHPWLWPELDCSKPRLQRLPSGKLICRTNSELGESPLNRRRERSVSALVGHK
jgi:hypothetical protein